MNNSTQERIVRFVAIALGDTPTPQDRINLARLLRDVARQQENIARTGRKRKTQGELFIRWENTKSPNQGKLHISRRLYDMADNPARVDVVRHGYDVRLVPLSITDQSGYVVYFPKRRGPLPYITIPKKDARYFFDTTNEQRLTARFVDGYITTEK